MTNAWSLSAISEPWAILLFLLLHGKVCHEAHLATIILYHQTGWIVGRSCFWRTFKYHSLFMIVFFAKILREPLTWLKSNPTHEWSEDASLLPWDRTDGGAHFGFSIQAFSQMRQTFGKMIHQSSLCYLPSSIRVQIHSHMSAAIPEQDLHCRWLILQLKQH